MQARATAFYERMRRRRSVRDFDGRAVPRELIESAIRTAGSAPNGANLQPWHFVAIGDPAMKRQIRLAAEVEEREFYQKKAPAAWLQALSPLGTDDQKPFLETAPWLIAIFSVNSFVGDDGELRPTYYAKESTGIAVGFLITALHQSGLATLTHTPSPMAFLNDICQRPTSEKPFLLLVVGYPAVDARVPSHAVQKKALGAISTWY